MMEDMIITAIANLPNFAVALLVLRWQHMVLEKLMDTLSQIIDRMFSLQDKLTDEKPPE